MSGQAYQAVTDRIVELLERGCVPWRKPWHLPNALPVNAVTRKPYRGVNVFVLGSSGYRDGRWLTFKQARELGGTVRSGERCSPAVFWKWPDADDPEASEDGAALRLSPILRRYSVFNVEQCEGLRLPPLPDAPDRSVGRIERAEVLARSMPSPPRIEERGNAASYSPAQDLVRVPPIEAFESADTFYATLFHELGHATGHQSRLARRAVGGDVSFGSEDYSREELVAELASAFCCSEVGIDNSILDNAASYIHGWIGALKQDSRAVVMASAQARKAADYIIGVRR